MNRIPISWSHGVDEHAGAPVARQEWESIVDDYEANPDNPYLSWLYLGHHPAFWETSTTDLGGRFQPVLDFSSAWGRRHCLELSMAQDDDAEIVVTLEIEPVSWPGDKDSTRFIMNSATHEDVIVDMAEAVHAMFGNDREFLTQDDEGRWYG